jgi:hypothetical protein
MLGIGLAILWVAGMNDPLAPPWLTWLIGVAALGGFVCARGAANGPLALSVGLLLLWAGGLVAASPAWLSWWIFGFASASFLLGIVALRERRPVGELPFQEAGPMDRARDRFRKGA